jgi:pSer/pThr/pTyr-binding forkhead associated (FHA) protein
MAGQGAVPHPAANDDPGMTVVRPVMPMYVLRGLAGGAFGRSYPLDRALTVGRSPECDIHIPDPGLSRVHARLVPGDDGVRIEDLDSTNGSFLNDHRVRRETAGVGDEIAFDKVRFRLVGTGAHAHHEPRASVPARADGARPRRWFWPMAGAATVATAVLVAVTLL